MTRPDKSSNRCPISTCHFVFSLLSCFRDSKISARPSMVASFHRSGHKEPRSSRAQHHIVMPRNVPRLRSSLLELAVRARWLFLFPASLCGCAQLHFLKGPSVPRARGESETVRGPAFGTEPVRTVADALDDWAGYNNTLTGERFSPLDQINPANAGELGRVCTYQLGERAAMESGPVIIDGTVYVTTAENTYAIDATTCRLRWRHGYHYSPAPPFDLKVNRGVAYRNGRLFRGANDGRVYALDAWTGKELWNVAAGNPEKGET